MENVVPQETSGGNVERHVPRRALLQMALAVTASGGFQSMAWADARTATSERGAVVASRESSPAIRSGNGLAHERRYRSVSRLPRHVSFAWRWATALNGVGATWSHDTFA